ncbi:hypothetical protein ACJRO7_025326 [Eucalyptus globulus]|uniref:Glycine-rich protein n=1 Tax=Eucalyptus globulus TaxID=34317 RepID=A0ABD3KAI9_EUCGL
MTVSKLVLAGVLLSALVCSISARKLAGARPDPFQDEKTFFRGPRYGIGVGLGSGGGGGGFGGGGGGGLGGGAGGGFGGGAGGGFGGGFP